MAVELSKHSGELDMRKFILAAIGSAALGLFSIGTASAAPIANGAFVGESASALVQDVAWRNVCKPRRVFSHGRPRVVRDCRRVWVGGPPPHAGKRHHGDRRHYR